MRPGKLLISFIAFFTIVSPFFADWNETHIYNPHWPVKMPTIAGVQTNQLLLYLFVILPVILLGYDIERKYLHTTSSIN